MEALTRLVADSLTRHGLDRPIDPRRLQWSRWFRCDSPHSLLVVPSKPGIFALAEEIAGDVARAPSPATSAPRGPLGGAALQRCDSLPLMNAASAAEVKTKRMLAVLQFSEDDDMAYVLDRMFTRINPMRSRLASGHCFVRFVVMDDQDQRRSICTALNQWLISSAEKASGLPSDFSSSLELTESLGRTLPSTTAHVGTATAANVGTAALESLPRVQSRGPSERSSASGQAISPEANAITHLDSGAASNLHCPQPLPSGF